MAGGGCANPHSDKQFTIRLFRVTYVQSKHHSHVNIYVAANKFILNERIMIKDFTFVLGEMNIVKFGKKKTENVLSLVFIIHFCCAVCTLKFMSYEMFVPGVSGSLC